MSLDLTALMPDPEHHEAPFPWFHARPALPEPVLRDLDALFDQDLPWVRHDSFYHCHLADVEDRVDPALRQAVATRLAALTGLHLLDDATVTAQRMDPGDHALAHTDRPLVGYEVVRLVVQLGGQGRLEDGGLFQVHPDAAGHHVAWTRAPVRGEGVAFVMRPHSHHSVTPTRVPRRTVVFHVGHRGNDDAVARAVQQLFASMRFDRLPDALAPLMDEAERRYDEDTTLRAGCIAWALGTWGLPADVVAAGYRWGLTPGAAADVPLAHRLAAWVTRLHLEDFDVDAWDALAHLPPPPPDDPTFVPWQLHFGRALPSLRGDRTPHRPMAPPPPETP